MKYYVYISDSKVDMLLQQIPYHEKKKLASEFKIDLKILGATWKFESELERGRIRRLEAVCEFIHRFGNVGNIVQPNEYIADTLLMNWNTYSYANGQSDIVYFSGTAKDSIIGLAGSTYHLIGGSAKPRDVKIDQDVSGSSWPPILRWLGDLDLAVHHAEQEQPESKSKEDFWLHSMYQRAQDMEGPKQNLEFLAKRLFQDDLVFPSRFDLFRELRQLPQLPPIIWHIILGTPLYVAMVD